ncbi:uncharacterized protein LOC120002028 [Tripterygium wilfordii]|uniref:uncharacterized protein LOC120002028 n=1 Tax=Tripterygium wilfordii TaxID=458696 RepID=UPI0018F8168F|nr:uncharacterized protein LOC120002028 [Tripterygium wilfordii]
MTFLPYNSLCKKLAAIGQFMFNYSKTNHVNWTNQGWTRGVKSSSILNECKPTITEDSKQWARRLQSKLLRLTYQVAENNDLREEMEAMIEEFSKKIYNFEVKYESEAKHERIKQVGRLIGNMKGLKKREGQRRTRRFKPPYEKRQGKGKKSSSSNLATSELVTTSQPNEFSQASQVSFFDLNIEPGQEFLSLLASTPPPFYQY